MPCLRTEPSAKRKQLAQRVERVLKQKKQHYEDIARVLMSRVNLAVVIRTAHKAAGRPVDVPPAVLNAIVKAFGMKHVVARKTVEADLKRCRSGARHDEAVTVKDIRLYRQACYNRYCNLLNVVDKDGTLQGILKKPYKAEQPLLERLRRAGWRFYGSDTCGWTTYQKNVFGSSDLSGMYVHCYTPDDDIKGVCAEFTEGFPSWKNTRTGAVITGFQYEEDSSKV